MAAPLSSERPLQVFSISKARRTATPPIRSSSQFPFSFDTFPKYTRSMSVVAQPSQSLGSPLTENKLSLTNGFQNTTVKGTITQTTLSRVVRRRIVKVLNPETGEYEEKTVEESEEGASPEDFKLAAAGSTLPAIGGAQAGQTLVPFGGPQTMVPFQGGQDGIDYEINKVLNKVVENFIRMKQEKREEFMRAFPQLKKMRINEPTEDVEIRQNPDGTTTTVKRTRVSTQWQQKTTIVNGVVQTSQQRAFLEYQGPEGGFQMKLAEGTSGNEPDSENEDEEEQLLKNPNRKSEAFSEIQDAQSALVLYDKSGAAPKLEPTKKAKDKTEKAWYAARELVDSEIRYVEKLKLLEDFRQRVAKESKSLKSLKEKEIDCIFSNISSLYTFHNDTFLPKLLERQRDWQATQRLCDDSMVKLCEWLKLYSEYTNNYSRAVKAFEDAVRKNKKFAAIVKETERLPECESLPLVSHLICPVQRVMRYHLLLNEYRKNLPANHQDQAGSKALLDSVLAAAEHANEIIKKLDRYKPVLAVQELLGNQINDLVTPTRELIKQGKLTKISARSQNHDLRYVFMFNDMLLVCSERKLPSLSKYNLRAIFDMNGLQVCEGDRLDTPYTFYVRASDNRVAEFYAENDREKEAWIKALWDTINNYKTCKETFKRSAAGTDDTGETNSQIGKAEECSKCAQTFKWYRCGTSCADCRAVCCKSCCNNRVRTKGGKEAKVCNKCWGEFKERKASTISIERKIDETKTEHKTRPNILQVPASSPSIYHGFVSLKTSTNRSLWSTRYFVVREDFVLYSYLDDKASHALTALPLPGCSVDLVPSESENEFKLIHLSRSYHIKCSSQDEVANWMAVIELASNAELPGRPPAA